MSLSTFADPNARHVRLAHTTPRNQLGIVRPGIGAIVMNLVASILYFVRILMEFVDLRQAVVSVPPCWNYNEARLAEANGTIRPLSTATKDMLAVISVGIPTVIMVLYYESTGRQLTVTQLQTLFSRGNICTWQSTWQAVILGKFFSNVATTLISKISVSL